MAKPFLRRNAWGCCRRRRYIPLVCVAVVITLVVAAYTSWPGAVAAPETDDNVLRYDQAQWLMTETPSPPAADAAWQVVPLPDWQGPARVGVSQFGRPAHRRPEQYHWYRFVVDEPAPLPRGKALYVPRFEDRALVLVNGVEVGRTYLERRTQHGWNVPLWVVTPAMVWHSGANEVLVRLDSPYIGPVLMSRLRVGPPELLEPEYASAYAWRITAAQVSCWLLAGLGVFALGLWAVHRNEMLHLLLGLSALAFALRQLHYFVADPVISLSFHWWLAVSSLPWAVLFVFLFACRFYDVKHYWFQWTLIVATVSSTLLILPGVGLDAYSTAPWIYMMLAPLGVIIVVLLTQRAWQQRGAPQILLVVGFLINVLAGAYDFALMTRRVSIEWPYLMPMGAAFLLLCFSMALASRYLGSLKQVENLNRSLEERVRERQRALEETYEKLRVLSAEQVLADERQRLMREIHDGIGANLVTTLAAVGQDGGNGHAAAVALQRAIADLKLTIDSLEPVDGDLPSLLGNLRYRLMPQLRQAGVQVDWEVNALPPLQWLRAPQALHVLRIAQEAFSNVLQHAGADRVTVGTGEAGMPDTGEPAVWVRIADNGRNPGPVSASRRGGKGVANMTYRAQALGGRLVIGPNTPSGTVLTLWLPVSAGAALAQ